MVGLARRARAQHRHALAALDRGDAAGRPGRERARDRRSSSTRSAPERPGTAPRPRGALLAELDVAVLRGNAGEVATLVGVEAECAESSRSPPATRRRAGAPSGRHAGLVASVTGPVDHVSDGERVLAIANGHELLAAVTGTGCMSTAITGCFLGRQAGRAARGGRRGAGRFRRRRRGCGGRGARARDVPRRALRRALRPRPGHARRAARVDEL